MIKLSNGMMFKNIQSLREFITGLSVLKCKLLQAHKNANNIKFGAGIRYAASTAIAAIDAAIENAELALKSAQRKEDKMKTAKKPAVKAVKKPVVKKAVKKPVAKKK